MRLVLVALLFALFSGAALGQPFATPQALIKSFYKPYLAGEIPEGNPQYRSEALNALYEADDENTPDGEMGALDFDPYIDGQDFDIADFSIGEAEIDGDTATVEVTFTNFGQPRRITYDLVFENGSWRIDDLEGHNSELSYRLSEIFAEAAGQ